MTTRPGSMTRPFATALLMAAAALALPACQSPLSPYGGQAESDQYYESLVAREIVRGTYGEKTLADGTAPTYVGGVREVARVDSPGPASNPAANYPVPTPNPSIASVSVIGRDAATLHMEEPIRGLSLQDAIARTVEHSLTIKAEAYNPAINEAKVVATEANLFDATLIGSSQWSVNDDPQLSTGSLANGQTWANSLGVKKVLPIGTQIQATGGVTLRDIAVPSGAFPPLLTSSYSSDINIQFDQPLLRGFGEAVNSANIYLAQRDLRISQSAFRQQVMTTVGKVEEAYWNLVLARTNVDINQRLVVASEQTYADVYARIPIDATSASVNQALSALVSRQFQLVNAQAALRKASNDLKTLMNDPDLDIESNILIDPTDRPVNQPPHYDLLDCIDTSLRQRPEMQQARLELEKADINITVAKNNLLPKLDLTFAMQPNGLDHGLDQSLIQTIDPMNAIDFTVGIKFEVPIGNRQAEAELNETQNQRRQAIVHMIDIAKQIVGGVKGSLVDVYTNYELIDLANQQRLAAAGEFQGIIDIENIRPRTPEFLQLKLDSQGNLAQAEQQLIQTIVTYNIAVERLELAKGTLLEFDRISLDKAPKPAPNELVDMLKAPRPTQLGK